jgi:hypothetical protein
MSEGASSTSSPAALRTGLAWLDRYLDHLVLTHRNELATARAETCKWVMLHDHLAQKKLPALEQHATAAAAQRWRAQQCLSFALQSRVLVRSAGATWNRWRLFAELRRREKIRAVANKTIDALIGNQGRLKAIAASAVEEKRALEARLRAETDAAVATPTAAATATPRSRSSTPRTTDKMTQAVDDAVLTEARQAAAAARSEKAQLAQALENARGAEQQLATANKDLAASNKRLQEEIVSVRLELRQLVSQTHGLQEVPSRGGD